MEASNDLTTQDPKVVGMATRGGASVVQGKVFQEGPKRVDDLPAGRNILIEAWPARRPFFQIRVKGAPISCTTGRGFTLEVFVARRAAAMELTTILNHCHHFSGFVYTHARFNERDRTIIEIAVRPRQGSRAVCSGCHQPAPGYDHLTERRFECRACGVVVEEVPWASGKHQLTHA